jgi:hypothetical protein
LGDWKNRREANKLFELWLAQIWLTFDTIQTEVDSFSLKETDSVSVEIPGMRLVDDVSLAFVRIAIAVVHRTSALRWRVICEVVPHVLVVEEAGFKGSS